MNSHMHAFIHSLTQVTISKLEGWNLFHDHYVLHFQKNFLERIFSVLCLHLLVLILLQLRYLWIFWSLYITVHILHNLWFYSADGLLFSKSECFSFLLANIGSDFDCCFGGPIQWMGDYKALFSGWVTIRPYSVHRWVRIWGMYTPFLMFPVVCLFWLWGGKYPTADIFSYFFHRLVLEFLISPYH